MGTISVVLVVFGHAKPDDGRLEVGVVTADGVLHWVRVLVRFFRRQADRTLVRITSEGRSMSVSLAGGSTRSMAVTARPSSTSKSLSSRPPSSSSFRR